jgi:hypothetical protein
MKLKLIIDIEATGGTEEDQLDYAKHCCSLLAIDCIRYGDKTTRVKSHQSVVIHNRLGRFLIRLASR